MDGVFKEQLMVKVEGTADFRGQKAVEYPHDAERNLTAQEELLDLHKYLESLPVDHELFQTMQKAIEADDSLESIVFDENELIRRYGFQDPAEPEAFVDELKNIYQKEVAHV